MILVFLISLFVCLTMYLLGTIIKVKLNLEKYHLTFSTPIGSVIFFGCLQCLYYPLQLLNYTVMYGHLVTAIFIGLIYIVAIYYRKIIIEDLKRLKDKKIQFMIAGLLFIALCYTYQFVKFPLRTDDAYFFVPFISNLVYNGVMGDMSNYMYSFQGLFNFQAFLMFFYEKLSFFPIYTDILDVGLISWQSAIILFFIFPLTLLDIYHYLYHFAVNTLSVNRWQYRILTCMVWISTLGMYWYLGHPYYGNTFRRITIIYLVYFLVLYIHERKLKYSALCMISIFALISQTSTGFFLGFMLLYSTCIIVVFQNRKRYTNAVSLMAIPLGIYAMIIRSNMIKYVLLIVVFVSILNFLKKIEWFEKIIYKLRYLIVFGVPTIFVIVPHLSLYSFTSTQFASIFREHTFDMVHPYLEIMFEQGRYITDIFNIIAWVSIVTCMVYSYKKKTEMSEYGYFASIILLTFFNPWVCKFVGDMITNMVYFRIYDIIFNPFTTLLFLVILLGIINNKGYRLVFLVSIVIVFSLQVNSGYLREYLSSNVNPIYHVEDSEVEVFEELREKMYIEDPNKPVIVASQIYGTHFLTDYPIKNVVNNRVDNIPQLYEQMDDQSVFTQIFYRKQHDDPRLPTDFNQACRLLKEREVEYAIIDRQYNYPMEDGLGYCAEQMFDNGQYRIYIMRYDWLQE